MKYKSLAFKELKALACAIFVFLIIAPSALLAQSATINIYVDLDNYASETTWTLTGPSGPIASGGPYGTAADLINNDYVVTESGAYTFTINDTFGDGISYNGANNENGTASYKITNDGTVEYQSANLPNFGNQDIQNFTVTVSGGGGSNLIGHWTFDIDGSDSSANSFDGTLSGNAAINNTTYKVGTGSIALDGVNDYLELSTYSATLGTLSQGTIAAWIKTSDVINPQTIFGVADMSPPANGFGTFGLYEGKLMFDIMEVTYQLSANSNAVVADGSWHHVAVTVDGTGNHLYIDGNQLSAGEKTYMFGTSSSSTAFFSSVNFVDAVQIGVTGENGGYAYDFNGLIDDVQAYNYALSALDISALANPTTPDATVGNFVWNDTDQDGIQDAGETGIQGVTVMLYTKTGVETAKTETDINGEYVITGITPGDYYLDFILPSGYSFSPQNQGGNDALDSDANVTTGVTIGTTLSADENDNTWDAGIFETPILSCPGNILSNPGFESGLTDWDLNGGNVTLVTDSHTGTNAARLDGSNTSFTQNIIGTPGNEYTFTVWAKATNDVTFSNVGLGFYTGSWGLIQDVKVEVSGDAWTEYSVTYTAPTGTVYVLADSYKEGSAGYTTADSFCLTEEAGGPAPTHPNCDYLYAVADAGDILVYMPRDGSSGAITIGGNNATLIEATALSLDAQTLYASNAERLGVLDWNTGNFTARASTFGTGSGEAGNVTFTDVDGLAFDPLSGILYGTHRWTDGSPEDLLFQINPTTGAHVPNAFGTGIDYVVIDTYDAVSLYDVDDIAISPVDGQMYGVINSSGGNDRIARINKYTGDVDDVGRSHTSTADVNDVEGLAFHNSGTFYGVTGSTSTMYEIDVTNALFTLVHTMDNSGDYESVAGLTCGSNLITGNVFVDADQDGINDVGESGQQNVLVKLYRDVNNDGLVDGGDVFAHSILTNSNGDYQFEVGTEGAFVLEIDQNTLPGGAVMTTDNKEEADFVNWGNTDPNNDFGYHIPDTINPPSSPTCDTGASLLWENNIVINGGAVTHDVGFYYGGTTIYRIPGPYPSAFNGSVDVTISEAISWDGYANRDATGDQPNERFRVVFKKSGTVVWSSPYSGITGGADGIDTGLNSDEWVGKLGTTVNLPNGADDIYLVHWSDATLGENDQSNANSVVPSSVCIGYEAPASATLGDFVWNDLNQDGIQDPGENGLQNVTVNLYHSGGSSAGTTTTNASGEYSFVGLTAGDYYVDFVLPNGYDFSPQDQTGDTKDSDANTSTGQTIVTTLNSGETDVSWDAGMYYNSSCPDNLLSNPSFENDFTDWTVIGKNGIVLDTYTGTKAALIKGGSTSSITQIVPAQVGYTYGLSVWAKKTLADYADVGFYFLDANYAELQDNLAEVTSIGTYAQYTAEATAPSGTVYVQAYAWPGKNEANEITVDEYCLTEEAPTVGSIGDYVWYDADADGIQDGGEGGLDDVPVELYLDNNNNGIIDGGDTHEGQQITAGGGLYEFTNLNPGNYLVTVADKKILMNYNLTGGTNPQDVSLSAGQNYNNADFGFYNYDPMGYIYYEPTGEIISGGLINIVGPGNITIVADGSNGYYEFYTDGTVGNYTIQLTVPDGFEISTTCLPSDPPAFDPTGGPNPTVLGSGVDGSTGYLADFSCGSNTFYYTFELEPGDPAIYHNNFPIKIPSNIEPPTSPSCNTGTSLLWANKILIDGDNVTKDVAFSNGGTTQYVIPGPYPAAFNGEVDIFIMEAISWDGHALRESTGEQPNERFRVVFKKSGSVVWSSPYTGLDGGSDGIDTGVISDDWVGNLGFPLNLPDGADEILLVHWSDPTYGENDNGNVNSVIPASVCIAYSTPGVASIGDFVWKDLDEDGIQDVVDMGIENVTVNLYHSNDSPAGNTTTDVNGYYSFTDLTPGEYYLEFVLPTAYEFTLQDQGANEALDSDADQTTGITSIVTLSGGDNDTRWDAGLIFLGGTIGDYVWYDANHDGLQNDGGAAVGLENIKLTLFDGTNTAIDITYTDNNGWYEFIGLESDDYTVLLENTTLPPVLVHATYDYDGTDSKHFAHLTLTEGETNNQIDFGYSDQPLPVTLASFRVEKETKGVVIKWITESEIENQGFIIERKENSSSEWIEIANYITNFELIGQGTVTYSTEYEYLDKLVYPGNTYEYRLGDIDYNGVVTYHATEMITINLSDIIGAPEAFSVKPAYPNPFNPSTVIEYGLPETGQVNVAIYDILGHSIKTLVSKNQIAGWHSISWYGTDNNGVLVPAGMYFGIVITEKSKHTIKLMYIK